MFRKILVANRGEIAIRAFRAAYELGARTVAVFPQEDRNSLHRLKADEAYQIGEKGHPVRAYLDVDEIIRVAQGVRRRRDLPRLRVPLREPRSRREGGRQRHRVHRAAGIRPRDGGQQGHGQASRRLGRRPGAALDRGVRRRRRARRPGRRHRLPALRQGRRRRRGPRHAPRRMPRASSPLPSPRPCARRPAPSATPRMFLEQAVLRPRHIEVQILADETGHTVHLFERDCSVQRRHQKVIEIAPAPNLDDAIRQDLHALRRSRSPSRSATRTPARSSSCSRRRASAPARSSSSR